MRDTDHFVEALKRVPTVKLRATLVRRVPLLPLVETSSANFLFASGKAGRFNPPGVECVYFAEDEPTAAVEYARHSMACRQPYVTYFAEVRLGKVIDLCSSETLAALDMVARELGAPWVGARQATAAQLLGDAVSRQILAAAIRFPSAAARRNGFTGANVVIFRHSVRPPDSIRILGPARKPLQKWPH
jgi:RES domain-containing protein